MEYKFEDALITGVKTGGSVTENIPLEEVSFAYCKVEWMYTITDHKTGKPKGNVEAKWNVCDNSET